MLAGQARITYVMAKDGLLPKAFATLHSKYQTPYFTTVVLTIFGGIMTALFPVEILGQLVSMGALLGFSIVCFGVFILRYTQPDLNRPFKTPFFPWVPILGTLFCLFQMAFLPLIIWMQLLIWILLGTAVYFAYGKNHSKLQLGKKQIQIDPA